MLYTTVLKDNSEAVRQDQSARKGIGFLGSGQTLFFFTQVYCPHKVQAVMNHTVENKASTRLQERRSLMNLLIFFGS